MLYQLYEWNHAALTPFRAVADATRLFYQNPLNPMSHTTAGRSFAAISIAAASLLRWLAPMR